MEARAVLLRRVCLFAGVLAAATAAGTMHSSDACWLALRGRTGTDPGAQPATSGLYSLFFDIPRPPDDALQLDPASQKKAEAFAEFCWGVRLEHSLERRTAEASKHYQAALELLPNSEFILGQLVSLLVERKGHPAVAETLLPLARNHPTAVRLNLVAAEALGSTKERSKAIQLLESCGNAIDWDDTGVIRRLAVFYWQEEEYGRVKRLLKTVTHRKALRNTFDVQYVAAMYHRSLLEKRTGETTGSEQGRVPEHSPDVLRKKMLAHAKRAAARVREVEDERDLRLLAHLLESQEAWGPLRQMLGTALATPSFGTIPLRLLHAESLINSGHPKRARPILLELGKDHNLSARTLAETGRLLAEAGDLPSAIRMYERLMSRSGKSGALIRGLAVLYLRDGRPSEAVELLRSAQPTDPQTQFLLARALHQQGTRGQALEVLRGLEADESEAANEFWSASEQIFLFAATVAEEDGQLVLALKWAEEARKRAPNKAVTANFLGYLLADHNRELDRAKRLIRQAVDRDPDNPAYLDSLAWVLFRQGMPDQALPPILHALRTQSGLQDRVILEHAGDICEACGLPLLARRYRAEAAAQTSSPDGKRQPAE